MGKLGRFGRSVAAGRRGLGGRGAGSNKEALLPMNKLERSKLAVSRSLWKCGRFLSFLVLSSDGG